MPAASTNAASKRLPPARGIRGYLASTRSPAVGAVVTLPLLLLYNVGLLMPGADEMNAADVLSRLVTWYGGLTGMLILNGTLVLLSVGLIAWLAKKGRFHPKWWWILILEGLAYGLLMGQGVIWAMGQAHLLASGAGEARHYSIPQALSLAAGAGYWEELMFRLVLVGGPIALARRFGKGTGQVILAGILAVVGSSVVFSLAHYLGPEPVEWFSFWYRAFSGVVFSVVFLVRGFAVAAYTHFLYDVVVMIF